MTKNYIIKILLLNILIGVAIYFWNANMTRLANPHFWLILVYYTFFTVLIHFWLLKNTDPKKFIMRFMGITGIKLFINLIVILIYGLTKREGAITFALGFFMIYFVFTFFEIRELLTSFNNKN
jgi:hypothetical protein